ncbi:hypothetical protein V1227_04975 [Lentzea sp. DG1S-22]|uniref:hypothetical protein n=1 Tax=Lentzea sp. DG1S-22 TaxID=3108822 RepID=UPI002E78D3F4|nr:hypothetical protein [Lentzea sp. DG1S-22]WVH82111.1 hypothetical protein V1227_04975 [Lentzea sp. DG1S-22]
MTRTEKKFIATPLDRDRLGELPGERLDADPTQAASISLNVIAVGANGVTLGYTGLNGNHPSTYGNAVFVWQNEAAIPYGAPPLATTPLKGNSPSGTTSVEFDVKVGLDYVLGYSTGGTVESIASWAYIPPQEEGFQYFSTTTAPVPGGVTSDVVVVKYSTPAGNDAAANKDWAGIWVASTGSFTNPPKFRADAPAGATGRISVYGTYTRDTTYTIGYFTGKSLTTLAATCTFST